MNNYHKKLPKTYIGPSENSWHWGLWLILKDGYMKLMLPAGEIWNFQQRCPVPCSAFYLFLFWKSVYCLSLWWEAGSGPTEGALSEEDWGGSCLWKRQFKGLKSLTGEVSQKAVPGSELTASLILQLTVLIGLLQLNRLWWYSSHSCIS